MYLWKTSSLALAALAALAGCLGPINRAPAKPRPPAQHFERAETGYFQAPLTSFRVLSPFGRRGSHFHAGMDLLQTRGGGDPIFAAAAGVVVEARQHGHYGRTVLLRHANGYQTRYAHMRQIAVETGRTVRAGETLGIVGQTGRATTAHLHFEIINPNGRAIDPSAYILPK